MCLVNFELYITWPCDQIPEKVVYQTQLHFESLIQTDVTDVGMPAELSGYILDYIIIYIIFSH